MVTKIEEEDSSKCLSSFLLIVKGTVVFRIWIQQLILILYTAVILYLHNFVEGLHMNFPMTLVPVLGVVTGLLLVFRTNTAYDRYWDGRKIWSHMTHHLRCLTLSIWTGVNDSKLANGQDLVEKISAINLVIAFAFATKNYLRGEYSYNDPDLELINYLPRFQKPKKRSDSQNNIKKATSVESESSLTKMGRELDMEITTPTNTTTNGSTTILFPNDKDKDDDKLEKKLKGQRSLKAHDFITPSKIPMEIIYYLFAYHKRLAADYRCEITTIKSMNNSIISLVDCLTQFERIVRTPIPLAYNIHLHCVVWLYLLALPFQVVGTLNWWSLAVVPLASFALLGILAIGFEIENPFGYDDNDLPLDDYCNVLRDEMETTMSTPIPSLETWMIHKKNFPLAPHVMMNAQQLSAKTKEKVNKIVEQGMADRR